MATKSKPTPTTLTPLVADGLRLIAEAEAITIERNAINEQLKAKDAELASINEQLIALGAGRYRDNEEHVAIVIGAVEPRLAPDTFTLRSADDEAIARALAGESFAKLFDRHVRFAPKDGFAGIAGAVLTPAKARDIIALTIVPGQLTGGRRAYVRWKN
jgi:hypothetical protein